MIKSISITSNKHSSNANSNSNTSTSTKINASLFNSLCSMDDCTFTSMTKYISKVKEETIIIHDLPDKIEGTYKDDYNILYIDDIIRKKLKQEKYTLLDKLKIQYKNEESKNKTPQTYIVRENTLLSMEKIQEEIRQIENGEKLIVYNNKVKELIAAYKKYNGLIKTVVFNANKHDEDDDEEVILDDVTKEKFQERHILIEQYLEIASKYISINLIKINNPIGDICQGCGTSLAKIIANEDGMIRCPNLDCQTEHDIAVMHKLCKDGTRITVGNNNDDSIDNFLRAFVRYQGLQPERPPEIIYSKLDEYFTNLGQPTGEQIKKLLPNKRGKRGNTDHKMLWIALSKIGYSEFYKLANYIGHIYWGWELPNIMHLKELIIYHYNETQRVYYQIPVEERRRESSLGTSYRLWRHLQLVGHECYFDEFKIVTNNDSLHSHDNLWKLMVEGTNDPNIYYIN